MKTLCGINRKYQWFTVDSSQCYFNANRHELIGQGKRELLIGMYKEEANMQKKISSGALFH